MLGQTQATLNGVSPQPTLLRPDFVSTSILTLAQTTEVSVSAPNLSGTRIVAGMKYNAAETGLMSVLFRMIHFLDFYDVECCGRGAAKTVANANATTGITILSEALLIKDSFQVTPSHVQYGCMARRLTICRNGRQWGGTSLYIS